MIEVGRVLTEGLADADKAASHAEEMGFDGVWTVETKHDPFFPALMAAGSTSKVRVGTSVAIAFARSPMTMANVGYDLQVHSGGRFVLGLGSQVRAHIENRFSMPWGHPAARMREFVLALRAIWASWQDGTRLDFNGDFYRHTLMTPEFNPGPNPFGPPRVVLGAVGERMTEVAGEVADGLFAHAFTTEKYLRQVTLPALQRGRARVEKERPSFEIACPALIVTGRTPERMEIAAESVRQRIAFYASTPAYRPVLETHGAEALQGELNALSKQGKWVEMGRLIDDGLLNTFAVVAEPAGVGPEIEKRFGGILDQLILFQPYELDLTERAGVLEGFKQRPRRTGEQ